MSNAHMGFNTFLKSLLCVQIIDEKSLIKKYQREISTLKQELDQLKRGMLAGVNHEEIMNLRQQVFVFYGHVWCLNYYSRILFHYVISRVIK